jgi:nicotinamidase-related amidase
MPRQPLFVGNPVLVVVDIQSGAGQGYDVVGIDLMDGNAGRIANAEKLVAAARENDVPIVFFQEVHRPSGVDFGRELDGAESRHCVEGEPATELWPTLVPEGDNEFHIRKRRYSCFIGTDLEILLRGLKAETLVLIGGLTERRPARRLARRHGVPPGRCPTHHRGDRRRLRRTRGDA